MMEDDHPDVRWSGKGKYRRPVSEKQIHSTEAAETGGGSEQRAELKSFGC